jgi:hypothetical protein
MKLFSVLGVFCCAAWAATNPQLGKVQSVYILPMNSGMDQFLANRLTSLGVFQVVADPQKADSVLTDSLGRGFEDKLKELYPPPPAVKKAEEKEKNGGKDADVDKDKDPNKEQDAEKDKDKEKDKDSKSSATGKQFESSPVQSTWARGRGNIFLVDRQTRTVVWSVYERPKNTTADELSKAATRVVQRLKKDLEPPKEAARNQ